MAATGKWKLYEQAKLDIANGTSGEWTTSVVEPSSG